MIRKKDQRYESNSHLLCVENPKDRTSVPRQRENQNVGTFGVVRQDLGSVMPKC